MINFKDFAKTAYNNAQCKYDGKNYYTHIQMVENGIDIYRKVFKSDEDYSIACASAIGHDLIEDANLTFNDIQKVTNKRIAQTILALTDVPEENRLLRHLNTMDKTVKNYIAIIVKMCDIRANAIYSKDNGSSMYKKYVEEYEYRRPIFKIALKWYNKYLDNKTLELFWDELDKIHNYKKQV
jgi:(p)ppGpp synthase/HD superfamily hydrolase